MHDDEISILGEKSSDTQSPNIPDEKRDTTTPSESANIVEDDLEPPPLAIRPKKNDDDSDDDVQVICEVEVEKSAKKPRPKIGPKSKLLKNSDGN